MGSFNILYAEVQCSNCKSIYKANIQFKFGNTWQFKYNFEDIIQWGGNDVGESNLSEVKVYGILEEDECPACRNTNMDKEFDIFIESDLIKEIKLLSDPKDYFDHEGTYNIIKK